MKLPHFIVYALHCTELHTSATFATLVLQWLKADSPLIVYLGLHDCVKGRVRICDDTCSNRQVMGDCRRAGDVPFVEGEPDRARDVLIPVLRAQCRVPDALSVRGHFAGPIAEHIETRCDDDEPEIGILSF